MSYKKKYSLRFQLTLARRQLREAERRAEHYKQAWLNAKEGKPFTENLAKMEKAMEAVWLAYHREVEGGINSPSYRETCRQQNERLRKLEEKGCDLGTTDQNVPTASSCQFL